MVDGLNFDSDSWITTVLLCKKENGRLLRKHTGVFVRL